MRTETHTQQEIEGFLAKFEQLGSEMAFHEVTMTTSKVESAGATALLEIKHWINGLSAKAGALPTLNGHLLMSTDIHESIRAEVA